jgi:RNA-directed DNA polymerase
VNVDRRYIRRLRAILHSCSLLGTDVACAKHYGARELNPKQLETFRCKLKGQIEFVGQVRGKDDNLYKKFKALWEQI